MKVSIFVASVLLLAFNVNLTTVEYVGQRAEPSVTRDIYGGQSSSNHKNKRGMQYLAVCAGSKFESCYTTQGCGNNGQSYYYGTTGGRAGDIYPQCDSAYCVITNTMSYCYAQTKSPGGCTCY